MECVKFMKILKALLTTWSPEKPLCKIPKSCCPNCTTLAFDFDEIKDSFCKKLAMSPLNSADSIYLDEPRNTIYFLEMKDLQKYRQHQRQHDLTEQQFIEKFFTNKQLSLANKAIDSYVLILAIVGYYAEKFSGEEEFSSKLSIFSYLLNNHKLQVKYFVIVNMSYIDYVTYEISDLSMSYDKFRFLKEVNIIRADDIDNFIQISHSTD
jgi:hypothetical protein